MKKLFVLAFSLLMLSLTACSAENGTQQLETARFEEKQNNKEHAIKLYEEVVSKYPDSANAKTARERLAVLKGNK